MRTMGCSPWRLGVGFDHPQPFINSAGNLGEEIGGVGVTECVRLIDRISSVVSEGG